MTSHKGKKPFHFKQFTIHQDKCTMKIGTDGVLLGAWADTNGAQRILDIGTGTGVIAVMMAQRAPEAEVFGVEINQEAFEQARENALACPWPNRLFILHAPIQQFSREHQGQFDLILSNPPFFTGGTFSNSQDRNDVRHTAKLSHSDLLSSARRLLSPHGKFCVILPLIEGLRFQELAQSYHLYCSRLTEVRSKAGKPVERVLLQLECHPKTTRKDSLIIQKEGQNEWTEAYIALTQAFYLNM